MGQQCWPDVVPLGMPWSMSWWHSWGCVERGEAKAIKLLPLSAARLEGCTWQRLSKKEGDLLKEQVCSPGDGLHPWEAGGPLLWDLWECQALVWGLCQTHKSHFSKTESKSNQESVIKWTALEKGVDYHCIMSLGLYHYLIAVNTRINRPVTKVNLVHIYPIILARIWMLFFCTVLANMHVPNK